MAIWDKVREGIDKAGKAAQDVIDEGKLRIDAYRAREQADKAAEALGYAVFHAWENSADLDAEAKERLVAALRQRHADARRMEADLAAASTANAGQANTGTANAGTANAGTANDGTAAPPASGDSAQGGA